MKCSRFSASATALLVVVVVVVVASWAPTAESVTCNPYELMPCLGAFTGSGQPSAACCAKLKEQESCLCQYIQDPSLGIYVKSPNARRVLNACGVPVPRC